MLVNYYALLYICLLLMVTWEFCSIPAYCTGLLLARRVLKMLEMDGEYEGNVEVLLLRASIFFILLVLSLLLDDFMIAIVRQLGRISPLSLLGKGGLSVPFLMLALSEPLLAIVSLVHSRCCELCESGAIFTVYAYHCAHLCL